MAALFILAALFFQSSFIMQLKVLGFIGYFRAMIDCKRARGRGNPLGAPVAAIVSDLLGVYVPNLPCTDLSKWYINSIVFTSTYHHLFTLTLNLP